MLKPTTSTAPSATDQISKTRKVNCMSFFTKEEQKDVSCILKPYGAVSF